MALPEELVAALTRVVEEYTQKAPAEVYRVFPQWQSELRGIVLTRNEEQLQTAIAGLDGEVAKCGGATFSPYHFAKHALQAALDVHAAWSRHGAVGAQAATVTAEFLAEAAARSIVVDEAIRPELLTQLLSEGWEIRCEPPKACGALAAIDAKDHPEALPELLAEGYTLVCEPPRSPKSRRSVLATAVLASPVAASSPVRAAPSAAAASPSSRADVIREVLCAAPAAVRAAFPDFEAELRAMLSAPEEQLRSTVQKLSVALADLEVRCFTDAADAATHLEAQAMAFGVTAMRAVLGGGASVVTAQRVTRPATPDFVFRSLGPAEQAGDVPISTAPPSALELEVQRMPLTQAIELCDMPEDALDQLDFDTISISSDDEDAMGRSVSLSSEASKATTVRANSSFGARAPRAARKPHWIVGGSMCGDGASMCGESLCAESAYGDAEPMEC